MNYRIETKEAFDIFGIETVSSLIGEEGYMTPGQLWQKCQSDGRYEQLFSDAGSLPGFLPQSLCMIHGAENYRKTEENTFAYMLCAFVSDKSKTEGYQTAHIPAQTYVIFSSDGFSWGEDFYKILADTRKKFYSEWLPISSYERADAASFEIYGGTTERGYIELWYPIVPKA